MIKCDGGTVEVKGSGTRVASELACLMSSIMGIFEKHYGHEAATELFESALVVASGMMGEVRNELQH